MKLGFKKRAKQSESIVQTVISPKTNNPLMLSAYERQTKAERELYSSLRESVPIIDAAISKIVRLLGTFKVTARDSKAQSIIDDFIKNVCINGSSRGMYGFICTYIDELLTYGEAVGEMVLSNDREQIAALYSANLDDVRIVPCKSPLKLLVFKNEAGEAVPVKNQELVVTTLLNPKSGTACGTSVLKSLPFVSSILLRIFSSLKTNWERVGDVRFAVTYKPEQNGAALTQEGAKQIADEWKKAMRSESVCDFVSVGDISVKVIGAENQMPDCDIPIKHIMEQILAKLSIPPFMLGISWSSTERMSEQQADILTSELEYYREVLNPVISRIIDTQLRLCGFNCGFDIEWNNINLQDSVELSQARLNNAKAMQIEKEYDLEADIE